MNLDVRLFAVKLINVNEKAIYYFANKHIKYLALCA